MDNNKDIEWKIKELTHSRDIWYKKCMEYEKILFELGYFKIEEGDEPF